MSDENRFVSYFASDDEDESWAHKTPEIQAICGGKRNLACGLAITRNLIP